MNYLSFHDLKVSSALPLFEEHFHWIYNSWLAVFSFMLEMLFHFLLVSVFSESLIFSPWFPVHTFLLSRLFLDFSLYLWFPALDCEGLHCIFALLRVV